MAVCVLIMLLRAAASLANWAALGFGNCGCSGSAAVSVAVVLGSGWRPAADLIGEATHEVPMAELPGFLAPTVAGREFISGAALSSKCVFSRWAATS